MKDKSQISYWYEDENILTIPTTVVPKIGERIHFDTRMDESWYDTKFPNKKLFREGFRGKLIVSDVKRYYKSHDYVLENGPYEFPSQRTVEEFEVFLISLP
jgi:hypothetical protein